MSIRLGCLLISAVAILNLAPRLNAGGDGFESLFNGKDLTGWKYGAEKDLAGKTETADKRFTVKGGVIVAEEGKGIKDLYTIKDFNGNFHLQVEFRASPKSDSGVYVRGPQLQVRDYLRRGERKSLKGFKNDDWNLLDIVVTNNKLITKVNGKEVTAKDTLEVSVTGGKAVAKLNGKEVDIGKIDVTNTAIANCKCNGEFLEDMPVPNKSAQGVGLQAETGKFEFRNVRIKKLP